MNHKGYIKSVIGGTCLALACATLFFSCARGKKRFSGDDMSHHVIITYLTTGDRPTNGATEKMLKKLNEILEISMPTWAQSVLIRQRHQNEAI